MNIINNRDYTLREDLQEEIQQGSRVSIAAACFSIYAYQELKKQSKKKFELVRKIKKMEGEIKIER